MNVTKYIAEKVAEKMVQPMADKINSLEKNCIDIAEKAINEATPELVKECFIKHRSYVLDSSCFTLSNGSQLHRINLGKDMPANGSWNPKVEIGKKEMEQIDNIQIEIRKIEADRSKTENAIISTLLKLKTFKRVQMFSPEIYEFLKEHEDNKPETSLALPMEDILSNINKYK